MQESAVPDPGRSHDVSGLTDAELERARRDLQASLALARPGSTACVPMLAQLSAIESELAGRYADGPDDQPPCPLRRRGQPGDRDVMDMGAGQAVRAGVVLEGGDYPLLRFVR